MRLMVRLSDSEISSREILANLRPGKNINEISGLPPGMEFAMDGFEATAIDVGIDLGSGNI